MQKRSKKQREHCALFLCLNPRKTSERDSMKGGVKCSMIPFSTLGDSKQTGGGDPRISIATKELHWIKASQLYKASSEAFFFQK